MLISFIVCTSNRLKELKSLFESIEKNKKKSNLLFEVLVVDQSNNRINKKIVEDYNFTYLHSKKNGLSYSRNLAMKLSNGKFISFLDDDSYLDENYLNNLKNYLMYDFISGRILTIENKNKPLTKYQINKEFEITKNNFDVVLSSGLIFKSSIIKKVGYLDEDFGIGGKYGASEEADYVLRFLKNNFNGFYTPTIKIFHPKFNPNSFSNIKELKIKFFNYGRGRGALLLKHAKFLGINILILQFIIRILLVFYSIIKFDKNNYYKNLNLLNGMYLVYFKKDLWRFLYWVI